MSGKQKALLVCLAVLLIGLFVVAVAGRRGDGNGDAKQHNSFVDWLGKLGAGAGAVDPATVTATCNKQGEAYAVVGACSLHVKDPGSMKMLILRSGAQFHVTAPGPGDTKMTMDDDVAPSPPAGAVAKVAVDKETTVTVVCPGIGTTCLVTVAKE
jgi:hypothetical protein